MDRCVIPRSILFRHVERIATAIQIIEGAEAAEACTRVSDIVSTWTRFRVEQVADAERYIRVVKDGTCGQVEQVGVLVTGQLQVALQGRSPGTRCVGNCSEGCRCV